MISQERNISKTTATTNGCIIHQAIPVSRHLDERLTLGHKPRYLELNTLPPCLLKKRSARTPTHADERTHTAAAAAASAAADAAYAQREH